MGISISNGGNNKCLKMWSDLYKQGLSPTDIEEIQTNLANFFKILRQWEINDERRENDNESRQ